MFCARAPKHLAPSGSVHFPDARIECEDQNRHVRHEDIEVVTAHDRGAHAVGTARHHARQKTHDVIDRLVGRGFPLGDQSCGDMLATEGPVQKRSMNPVGNWR